MSVVTLHEVEEAVRRIEPDTLREMVFQVAHGHTTVCELTSRIGDCAHIDSNEIRDRVDALTVAQLAAILAPSAWMSIDLHRRVSD